MTQILIQDLDPTVTGKLKIRALRNGRSLEAEVKAILEAAAEAEAVEKTTTRLQEWEAIDKARAKYAGRTFSDSAELLREERNR
jgi:plasmid stability protein